MTIYQYFILGWIGCGIFILFALIWLFGLITSQSRLRFACDFFMVGALFIMLIGFGGRHKQVLLQEKRQAGKSPVFPLPRPYTGSQPAR
ncbi:hypothetical protein ACXO3Q_03415 [Lactobacillus delbrueckii subsp. bulgaricus]